MEYWRNWRQIRIALAVGGGGWGLAKFGKVMVNYNWVTVFRFIAENKLPK